MDREVKPVAMFLNTDRCIGCQTCQTSCREANGFGYDERWMQSVRRDPYYVNGKLRRYHLVAPSLDRCAAHVANDPEPACVMNCSGGALKVGAVEEMLDFAKQGHGILYLP